MGSVHDPALLFSQRNVKITSSSVGCLRGEDVWQSSECGRVGFQGREGWCVFMDFT